MQKIVLATNNKGKIREIKSLMSVENYSLLPQSDLGVTEIDEVGLTFIENAILKARHAAQMTGLPAIADDSGLVVAALNGEPGIYSARYAGPSAQAENNIQTLLSKLKDVPEDERCAFFYCVIVLLKHEKDPAPLVSEGKWHGNILLAPQGEQGFGYDPIFYVPTHQCSAAQLPLEIKNKISHRGQAVKKLVEKIETENVIIS